ncbi:MAG: hypothetical protein ACE5R4_11330 [Armatimonadota bacterium]
MRVGIVLRGHPDTANAVSLALIEDCGFRSLFIECEEDRQDEAGLELAAFTRECRSRDLRTYALPLGYGRVLASRAGAGSPFLGSFPHVRQVDSRGGLIARACPNHPEFLEWMQSRMLDLAEMLACDGFVWAEPSFHYDRGTWGCRCQYCQQFYAAEHDEDMPVELDHRVLHFRQKSLMGFLLAATAAIKGINPAARSVVKMTPWLAPGQVAMESEYWQPVLASAALDGLAVSADWSPPRGGMEDVMSRIAHGAMREAEQASKQAQIWVGGSPAPEDRLLEALRFGLRLGATEMVVSDFESLVRHPRFPELRGQLRRLLREAAAAEPAT